MRWRSVRRSQGCHRRYIAADAAAIAVRPRFPADYRRRRNRLGLSGTGRAWVHFSHIQHRAWSVPQYVFGVSAGPDNERATLGGAACHLEVGTFVKDATADKPKCMHSHVLLRRRLSENCCTVPMKAFSHRECFNAFGALFWILSLVSRQILRRAHKCSRRV
jgi:hypothetical protein